MYLAVDVSELEAAGLVQKYVPSITKLAVRFTAAGAVVIGTYNAFFGDVLCETTWALSAADTSLVAKLRTVVTAGLPFGIKLDNNALLNIIRTAIASMSGVRIEDDAIIVDLGDLLKTIDLVVYQPAIECREGELQFTARARLMLPAPPK